MDDIISNIKDSLAVGASAQTAKDRSDGSYRFVDAMQAARRQARLDPGPPVEVHLSQSAREYAQHAAQANGPESEHERNKKLLAYSPRMRNTSETPDETAPDQDGSHSDD
jgi:hypothetical protein